MYIAELPRPILFHPLKHHLQYIREFIRMNLWEAEIDLKAALLTVGSSQFDFYTGELTTLQITREVIRWLQEKGILTADAYQLYLTADGSDYSLMRLSDGSEWVLRRGFVADRYVHLHPARYSPYTLRIKANTLKTAIAALLFIKRQGIPEIDLQVVNQVRTEWLGLAPVKHLEAGYSLKKLIQDLGEF